MTRTSLNVKACSALLFLVVSNVSASGEQLEACRMAVSLTIENVRYQIRTPLPDRKKIQREFRQLAALYARCKRHSIQVRIPDCAALIEQTKVSRVASRREAEIFATYTTCALPAGGVRNRYDARAVGTLIQDTLKELRISDGEGVVWISNDLFALMLLFPEEMMGTLEGSEEDRSRFIDSMGNVFEDLDDSPGATHAGVRQKQRVMGRWLRQQTIRWGAKGIRLAFLKRLEQASSENPRAFVGPFKRVVRLSGGCE